uniref:Purple acid phosphatase n=1 Tax=Fagus sylvatica TaxID=28930 RepID=A0A2N9FV34_FAGSY
MPKVARPPSLLLQLTLTSFIFLSFVNNGNAGITSTFIRSEWPSVDIPLDNEVFVVPKGHNAPQQVHITQGDYDGKAVIISWVTADEPGPSKVQYGTSEKRYEFSAEGRMTNYTFYKYKSGYIHHCLIDGLQYDTKYYYKIGNDDSSREFWFQTPPKIHPDASYKFGIIGDLGQTYNSLSTLDHYMQSEGQTVLFVGDLSYADRYEYTDVGLRWDTWGRFVERSTAYQPWIWSAGNHEIEYMPYMPMVSESVDISSPLNSRQLDMTRSQVMAVHGWMPSSRRSCGGYQTGAGPVEGVNNSKHVVLGDIYRKKVSKKIKKKIKELESGRGICVTVKYTPQWMWLREEFERVDREKTPWLIVVMHAPIYNSNEAHYMEGESMRAVFESWFIRYKVDLVFAGHVHAYERSYRISNIHYNVTSGEQYPVPDKSAPVYITVGDGGNQEGLAGKFRDPQPDYSAFREASYGHSTLEIKNRTHAFYHWNRNDDGKKVATDSFKLHNQYWASNMRRRKLKKHYLRSVLGQIAAY